MKKDTAFYMMQWYIKCINFYISYLQCHKTSVIVVEAAICIKLRRYFIIWEV